MLSQPNNTKRFLFFSRRPLNLFFPPREEDPSPTHVPASVDLASSKLDRLPPTAFIRTPPSSSSPLSLASPFTPSSRAPLTLSYDLHGFDPGPDDPIFLRRYDPGTVKLSENIQDRWQRRGIFFEIPRPLPRRRRRDRRPCRSPAPPPLPPPPGPEAVLRLLRGSKAHLFGQRGRGRRGRREEDEAEAARLFAARGCAVSFCLN